MIIYNVNKEKGTVVARFKGDFVNDASYWEDSLMGMIHNVFSPYFYSTGMMYAIVNNVLDSYADFVGKAKLHPEDTWDEEKGKRIAKQKLLDKWYKVKNHVLRDVKTYVISCCTNINIKIDNRMR